MGQDHKQSRRFVDIETARNFGQQLAEFRGDRTQEEMAALAGVSRGTWANYEAGRCRRLLSSERVKVVSAIVGMPVSAICARIGGGTGGQTEKTSSPDVNARDVIERLKQVTGCELDRDLAERLDKDRSTVASWGVRNAIPFQACMRVSVETGVSLDEIIFGKRPVAAIGAADADIEDESYVAGTPVAGGEVPAGREIVERLKKATGCKFDNDLAKCFNRDRTAVALWAVRNRVPLHACVEVSLETGVSLDELVFGKRHPQAAQAADRIDAALFDDCWRAAADLRDSVPSIRQLAVRTYNAVQCGGAIAENATVSEIAALLLAADGAT